MIARILDIFRRTPSDHARALSKLGHEQRQASFRATARRIREELQLPEDRRLAR